MMIRISEVQTHSTRIACGDASRRYAPFRMTGGRARMSSLSASEGSRGDWGWGASGDAQPSGEPWGGS